MANYVLNAEIAAKPTITSQSGAPSSTPGKVGDINIDTSTPDLYQAKGASSSADWFKVGGSGGYNFEDTATTTDATPTRIHSIYECKIEDSQGDVVHYPGVRIQADTTEEGIDAALIVAANPF